MNNVALWICFFRIIEDQTQHEPINFICKILSVARITPTIRRLFIHRRPQKLLRRVLHALSRRTCRTFIIVVFLYLTYTICYTTYYYEENIPFQRDLKLKHSDVFIEGELAAYVDGPLKHVDCSRLRHESQVSKDDRFLYTGVLTSHKTLQTLAVAVSNTWGMLTDKTDFYTGNIPDNPCDCENCKHMNVIQLPGRWHSCLFQRKTVFKLCSKV